MSDPVDIIIPTLRRAHAFSCFDKLHNVPWPYKLHVITTGKTWAQAINIGLKQTDKKNDVILMDDDVFITSETFRSVNTHYDDADIFGFKLLFPSGEIQHAGGIVRNGEIGHIGYNESDAGQYDKPMYVCHATTSCIYIKRNVLDELEGIVQDMPGTQMDDVDFNFRAIKKGFKILYLPDFATHLQSASKKFIPGFDEKVAEAYAEVKKRHFADPVFLKKIQEYPKPLAKLELA